MLSVLLVNKRSGEGLLLHRGLYTKEVNINLYLPWRHSGVFTVIINPCSGNFILPVPWWISYSAYGRKKFRILMYALWVSKSQYGKWSGFCNKYSNWTGKDNYGVILPLALEDRFHWNQWNYMHGSKIECWLIFTRQIKSAHKLVATCARRAIFKICNQIFILLQKLLVLKRIFYTCYFVVKNVIK